MKLLTLPVLVAAFTAFALPAAAGCWYQSQETAEKPVEQTQSEAETS
ncbi:MAG: hypothetical protein AAF899_10730 [Pseudomonadota bacterium]